MLMLLLLVMMMATTTMMMSSLLEFMPPGAEMIEVTFLADNRANG